MYEMTDRRSLERVVRAAERDDIEIDTAESEQIVGRLPEEADYPFEAYDFDPNVYADESLEERSRQWRNEKARRNADADKGRIEEVREILHDEEVVNFDDDETTQCPTCEGEGWTKTFGCGLCGLTTATPDDGSAEESSGSTESEIPNTPEEKPAAMAASTLHQPDTPRKIGEFPIVGDTPTRRSIRDALDDANQAGCEEAVKLRVGEAAKAATQAGRACGSFCGAPFHQWELPKRTDTIASHEEMCLATMRLWLAIYNTMDLADKCAGKIARFLGWVALAARCLFNARGASELAHKVAPQAMAKIGRMMRKAHTENWPMHVRKFKLQRVIMQKLSKCRFKLQKYWRESNLMGEGWQYSSRWRMLFFLKKYESSKGHEERAKLLRWKLGGQAALKQELPASSLQRKPKSNKKKQRHANQASPPPEGQKAVAAAVRTKRQKKQCGACGTRQKHDFDKCVKCFPRESNGSARDSRPKSMLQLAGKGMPAMTGSKRLTSTKVPRLKQATPKCKCDGCVRDCWFNPKTGTHSWACGMTCLHKKCNHTGSKAEAGTAPECRCHGCERIAYWDGNFNTYGTHCGTTCRDGKCGHQDRAVAHTVAQLKLPSAAAEELMATETAPARKR